MRAYLATTPKEIRELLSVGSAVFSEYLTPDQFEFSVEVGDEEREDLIAQLASDDSEELNSGKSSFVLAVDLDDSQLDAEKLEITFNQVAALMVGKELSWFAPEEIAFELDNWIH